MKLTFMGTEYPCARAVKNESNGVIRLYDGNGALVFRAVKVSDFSSYVLEGGEWDLEGGPYTIEQFKAAKRIELSSACNSAITSGIEVETSKGKEHFSLYETDQINLTTALTAIREGATSFLYHSDGNVCRLYNANEISLISNAATQHKLYHTTLCNHLFQQLNNSTTITEINNINYSPDSLSKELRESFNFLLLISKDL